MLGFAGPCASTSCCGGDEPTFSFEFFPPKTAAGEENFERALQRARAAGAVVRLGDLRRGRHDARQDGRDRAPHQGATTAWRRWRTSRASARRPRSCARRSTRSARPGIDNVLALRGDPPRGSGRSGPRPRAAWSTPIELVELLREDYDFAIARRVLPRDAHPRDLARGRPALPQAEGRRGRRLPDHAAVLRQRSSTSTSSSAARAIGIDGADHPGRHADHRATGRSSDHQPVRRDDARACARASSTRARTTPRRSPSSASPTRRCSAPSCSPSGAPGIHFCTLNRSPATRAILSALRLWRPWDAQRTGLGEPRRPPAVAS